MLPEAQQYQLMLNELRRQMIALLRDLPLAALNWRPLPADDDHATNSLAVLAAHVAGAEHHWIGEVVGRLPATRVRQAEFETAADDVTPLLAQLDAVGAQSTRVLGTLTAADLDGVRHARDREVPVRWAILHAIEHAALHLGHMQMTVQLWEGSESER